jgi:hypothetical protein
MTLSRADAALCGTDSSPTPVLFMASITYEKKKSVTWYILPKQKMTCYILQKKKSLILLLLLCCR